MKDYHENFSIALFAMELIGRFLFESFLGRFLLIRSNSLAYEDYQFHLFGVSGNTNYQNLAPGRRCGTWINKEKASNNSLNLKRYISLPSCEVIYNSQYIPKVKCTFLVCFFHFFGGTMEFHTNIV